jgi:glycine dehydrogenase subunit 2
MTMNQQEPLIYEISSPGRCGVTMPLPDVPETDIPAELCRKDLGLPEVSQIDVTRHYLRLSQLNYSIDQGFYPLGSCTMKYNPKINEDAARLPGYAFTHPLQDPLTVQGNLAIMFHLQEWLKEIGGFAGVTLQPAAGAHGEFVGILIMRAYHLDRGDTKRNVILIPDSAHGTNPASSAMSGFVVKQLPSDERGNVDLAALRAACDDTVVGLMLTNPNTLGLFEEHLEEVVNLVHGCGGLMYGDGANMNALVGIARPGDLGFDVLHYNLHKTFSTPHGGGGPGSGPVGVGEKLVDFLPGPIVNVTFPDGEDETPLYVFAEPKKSIGRVKSFNGNFGMLVRAYTYMRVHGPDGLKANSMYAVLNANYLRVKLRDKFPVPHDRICMHEFVCQGKFEGSDVRALDVSKRLMDYNFHPPTNYFPLIVPEALMIEPTETESKETLDQFIDAMRKIADEAVNQPELLHSAPHHTPVKRLDEVKAAKDLVLCCMPAEFEAKAAA